MVKSVNPAVSVLGLGAMGSALAGTLANAGYPVTGWNRSQRDVPPGVKLAGAPDEAVAAGPVALVCVLDHGAAMEILEKVASSLEGRTVVNLTSATPSQARDMAARAGELGAEYLDGNIMADPEDVGTERTNFLYSGSRSAFDAHGDLLRTLGKSRFLGEKPGQASAAFTAMVAIGYESWVAFLDGLAYGETEGFRATDLAPMITGMFGDMIDLLSAMASAAEAGDHPPAAGPLSVHAALMDDMIAARRDADGDSAQLERVKHLIDKAIADGRADQGFSALIEQLRGSTADDRTPTRRGDN